LRFYKALILALVIIILLSATYVLFAPKAEKLVIRIGYQPSTHQIAEFIIVEKGWLIEEASKLGYEIEIEEYVFPSGPPEMESFMSGKLDVAYVGATPAIVEVSQALGKGAPLAKIVGSVNLAGSALVVRFDFNYTNPESLKGAKVGVFPPGSIQDTILKHWLKLNNLTYGPPESGADVSIVKGGPQELVEALAAKKVDAVLLPDPAPQILEAKGIGYIAVKSSEMWLNHPCCVLTISDKFISEHRDLAKLIVKLHIKAQKFINEHVNETIEIATKRLSKDWGYNESFVRMVVEKSLVEKVTDLIFPAELSQDTINGIMSYAQVLYELGNIPTLPSQSDLFDLSLYNEALAELGG